MFGVALINMPFANLNLASIGLTQLQAATNRDCSDRVRTEIFYLNHAFAELFGFDEHSEIAATVNSSNRGLGDWIFRQAAFPTVPDNSLEYFRRYFPYNNEESQRLRALVARVRPKIDDFIEELIDRYRLDAFDIVGFTSMFSQTMPSLAVARHIRNRNPEVILVMGGANCEAPMGPELVKSVDWLDYVFSGPALKSFPLFVRRCLDGERERVGEVAGIFSKTNAATVRGEAVIGEELDIDDVLELDYQPFVDLVKQSWPERQLPITLPFETSRGCWWGERAHCTFCGLNGMTMAYRAMQPERALDMIRSLCSYDNVDRLICVDNIMPKNYLKSVFPFLKTPDEISIFYEVKSDLSEEDIRVLSEARVLAIQPGIEALATSTLKLMRKGVTSFTNLSFLMNCLNYGVLPVWNLLVGFPGERGEVFEQYLKDIPLFVHLPPPTGVYPIRFDRYSPYFKGAAEYGLDLQPYAFYGLTYPFPKETLANMAYYFGDRNYRAAYFQAVTRYLVPLQQAIASWQQLWSMPDPPELYMQDTDNEPIVHDSRSGVAETLAVSAAAGRVLGALSRRMGVSELRALLPDLGADEVGSALNQLKDKKLLFADGDRFMSIVFKQRPNRIMSDLRKWAA
jgi:magnesium-protoporphyrin IX monomethyl ester (oxidative) cyclase